MTDWREPYRSMDATGTPDDAEFVGWDWIMEQSQLIIPDGRLFNVETSGEGETKVFALYRGTELVAAATVFRDPMNFAVLLRWKAGDK